MLAGVDQGQAGPPGGRSVAFHAWRLVEGHSEPHVEVCSEGFGILAVGLSD